MQRRFEQKETKGTKERQVFETSFPSFPSVDYVFAFSFSGSSDISCLILFCRASHTNYVELASGVMRRGL